MKLDQFRAAQAAALKTEFSNLVTDDRGFKDTYHIGAEYGAFGVGTG